MKISIVVPVINEADCIENFYENLKIELTNLKNHSFFIIFVLDKSTDDTEKKIRNIIIKDPSCSCLVMSSVYGHQACLFAGLEYSKNFDATITMDGDMQHPPQTIKDMILSLEEGYDIVSADRLNYGRTSFLNQYFSKLFYKIFNYITDIGYQSYNTADFRIINKKVRELLIKNFREKNIFLRGVIASIGFKHKLIKYKFEDRKIGKSKYNFLKKLNFAINGFLSFSLKPLYLTLFIGFLLTTLSIIGFMYLIIKYFVLLQAPEWLPIITSIILLLGSINLLVLGLVGVYIGKIFVEVRSRPKYIVNDFVNINNN